MSDWFENEVLAQIRRTNEKLSEISDFQFHLEETMNQQFDDLVTKVADVGVVIDTTVTTLDEIITRLKGLSMDATEQNAVAVQAVADLEAKRAILVAKLAEVPPAPVV